VIYKAIQDAYKGVLMIGKFPFFVLNLELDPSHVDFNIHPKKLHIRFENEKFVYNKIYNVIRGYVEDFFVKRPSDLIESDLTTYINNSDGVNEDLELEHNLDEFNSIAENYDVVSLEQSNVEIERKLTQLQSEKERSIQLDLLDQKVGDLERKNLLPESILREQYVSKENFPKLRLISKTGQLSNKTYIVLEGINENGEEGLYLLDQHAASERINKEYFVDMYTQSKSQKQRLISPLKIDLTPSESQFLQANLNQIKKLGFNFEQFGGNSYVLREVPTIMGKLPTVDLIKDIITNITEIGKHDDFENVKEEIINYLACHKSIRGGDDLSLYDIRKLILALADCRDSYHCAHGRPTLKFLSFKELDKLFKRII